MKSTRREERIIMVYNPNKALFRVLENVANNPIARDCISGLASALYMYSTFYR